MYVRKDFEKVKCLNGFRTGTYFCREQQGNLVVDIQTTLVLLSEHFLKLLNGDKGNNSTNGEAAPVADANVNVPPSDYDEVLEVNTSLKINKVVGSSGLPADSLKTGCADLMKHERRHAMRLESYHTLSNS